MNSPAEPASPDAPQASQATKPLREIGAFVLLGANAVLLFIGLIRLLAPSHGDFTTRAGSTYGSFIGLEATVLPLLAVLLATHVQPVVPKAKLIIQAALGQYAFGAVLGALTFLIWTVGRLAAADVLNALLGVLGRVAWLALFGFAAFLVYQIWRTLFPKPVSQPGMYGQPQPGWPQQPGGYPNPGQQGGYPQAGQYGYPQSANPASAPPFGAQPSSQHSGPPFGGQQSAPQSAPPFGAPQSAPPFGAQHSPPQSAPPFGAPQSAPPFGAQPSPFAAPQPQSAPPFGSPAPTPGAQAATPAGP
ncbi:hypothetical protein ABT336_19610, partial [Micromonospora sp. NPDC000207]|uniref:hypothetical protein n=1 Tax=Micromonospora sp. NPDC000207 TaxID=3154246 RepID=UPI003324166E